MGERHPCPICAESVYLRDQDAFEGKSPLSAPRARGERECAPANSIGRVSDCRDVVIRKLLVRFRGWGLSAGASLLSPASMCLPDPLSCCTTCLDPRTSTPSPACIHRGTWVAVWIEASGWWDEVAVLGRGRPSRPVRAIWMGCAPIPPLHASKANIPCHVVYHASWAICSPIDHGGIAQESREAGYRCALLEVRNTGELGMTEIQGEEEMDEREEQSLQTHTSWDEQSALLHFGCIFWLSCKGGDWSGVIPIATRPMRPHRPFCERKGME